MRIHTLAQRIALGYCLMVTLLALAVILTIVEIRQLDQATGQLMEQREPTSKAGLELESGLHLASSTLRGWIITRDERFRTERKIVWADKIKASLRQLEELSPHWKVENIERLNRLKPLTAELEILQQQIEEQVATNARGANQLLEAEAMPLASQVLDILGVMLEAQRRSFRQDFAKVSARIDFLGALEWGLLVIGLFVSGVCVDYPLGHPTLMQWLWRTVSQVVT